MSRPDALPPLRDVAAAFGIIPKKRLGQHFLFDWNLLNRVVAAASPLDGVVEIGPGPGGLTRALLAAGAQKIVAVEADARCQPALDAIASAYPGRLCVVHADALGLDIVDLALQAADGALQRDTKIVANLPYNIGTALVVRWLRGATWPPNWTSATLMLQREVVARLTAAPGTKAYGRLSVLAQWRTVTEFLFDVSPDAFTPPPTVTSAVVRLTPRAMPLPVPLPALERLTAAAFGQRRKMLRAALRPLTRNAEDRIRAAGVDPTDRAEDIPLTAFVALAHAFWQNELPQDGSRPATP